MSAKSKIAQPQRTLGQFVRETIQPYKQLAPFLKPYRGKFALGIACGVAAGGVNGCYALVLKHVMEYVFPHGAKVVTHGAGVANAPTSTASCGCARSFPRWSWRAVFSAT